jgi:hypothetical protein
MSALDLEVDDSKHALGELLLSLIPSPVALQNQPKLRHIPVVAQDSSATNEDEWIEETLMKDATGSLVKGATTFEKKEPGECDIEDGELASGCCYDHKPLRDALEAKQFEEADQILRDSLIELAGEGSQERGYVYFTEVRNIPVEDMKTLDELWKKYSDDKFGFSVQRRIFNGAAVKKDWKKFFHRIDWMFDGDSMDTYRRWTAIGDKGNEFTYDAETAKTGHLPLTNTLRGTKLLEAIFAHPAFEAPPK